MIYSNQLFPIVRVIGSCTRYLRVNQLYKMTAEGRPKVFIIRSDFSEAGINLLRERCEIDVFNSEEGDVSAEELLKRIIGKDALFVTAKIKIDERVIQAAAQNGVKVIATMSSGLDHIDLEAVKKTSIKIGYSPGVLTEATAEFTVALLLATSRRVVEGYKKIVRNEWKGWTPSWMCGKGLYNSTVGFFGFGRLGQSVGKKLIPFGVKTILYNGPRRKKEADDMGAKFVDLETLLKESDFVIVLAPLTSETKGFFTKDKFLMMKRTAIFINSARGAIVNQEALVYVLENKIIAAAGLDVMTPEPLPADHPLVKLDNCVLTPHMASATFETRDDMAMLTAKNILAALDGQPMPAEVIL